MNDRILSVPETRTKCGDVSRNTLTNWHETLGFPAPVQLGPNRIGFRESEIEAWLESRPRGFLAPVAQPKSAA